MNNLAKYRNSVRRSSCPRHTPRFTRQNGNHYIYECKQCGWIALFVGSSQRP